MKHVVSLFAIVLLTTQGHGQVGAPRLGYMWDAGTRSFFSVEGVPGAAFLREAAEPGIEIAGAAVSQRARYALAIAGGDRRAYLFRIAAGLSEPERIDGATIPVDRIALSPSGAAAALYSESAGLLQVVTGLPQQPVVTPPVPVAAFDRMAISDDGALVVVATTDGGLAALTMHSTESRSLPISGSVSSIAFRPRSHDFLIAAGELITFVRAFDTEPSYEPVGDLPSGPLALAFSADGLRFVAAYPDGRIQMSDSASGPSPPVSCACRPNGLDLLEGDAVFGLRADVQQPLFLFDGAKNRVVFVGRDQQ